MPLLLHGNLKLKLMTAGSPQRGLKCPQPHTASSTYEGAAGVDCASSVPALLPEGSEKPAGCSISTSPPSSSPSQAGCTSQPPIKHRNTTHARRASFNVLYWFKGKLFVLKRPFSLHWHRHSLRATSRYTPVGVEELPPPPPPRPPGGCRLLPRLWRGALSCAPGLCGVPPP